MCLIPRHVAHIHDEHGVGRVGVAVGGFGGGAFGQTAFGGSTFGTFRTFRKSAQNFGSRYSRAVTADDDRPFIVLTETNLALAVYLFGSVLSLPD